jgi:hypothetical protein
MPQIGIDFGAEAPTTGPAPPRTRYLIAGRQDAWFIVFGGQEYGPYRSKREAKLFAIDAAHQLGGKGRPTEVVVAEDSGNLIPAWICGQHPYPPRD